MFTEINPTPNRGGRLSGPPALSQRPESMSGSGYVKFRNDRGVPEICIGVREFECIGVSPPQDHPHIYIDMGEADTILCPYCGTRFRFDPRLTPITFSLTSFRQKRASQSISSSLVYWLSINTRYASANSKPLPTMT